MLRSNVAGQLMIMVAYTYKYIYINMTDMMSLVHVAPPHEGDCCQVNNTNNACAHLACFCSRCIAAAAHPSHKHTNRGWRAMIVNSAVMAHAGCLLLELPAARSYCVLKAALVRQMSEEKGGGGK